MGIDSGKLGGIAVLRPSESPRVYPYSDATLVEIANAYRNAPDTVAIVEQVHAMPQQGVCSMFHFGQSVGFIHGVFKGCGIPIETVAPQIWKTHHCLIKKPKASSIELAHGLYPNTPLRSTPRSRTDSDGMAEALLIATWYRDTRKKIQ